MYKLNEVYVQFLQFLCSYMYDTVPQWALLACWWFYCYVDFQEVPHFSSPALMEKYALTEHLNYVYYLRRGQPSFAYANFVAAKLLGHSNITKRLGYRLMITCPVNTYLYSKLVIIFPIRLNHLLLLIPPL